MYVRYSLHFIIQNLIRASQKSKSELVHIIQVHKIWRLEQSLALAYMLHLYKSYILDKIFRDIRIAKFTKK